LREFFAGALMLVAIVAAHRFSLAYPLELSADESELLVQLGRYDHDLVPWRSVDGSTIGPVNPWFLMGMRGLGWPMTYGGLHLLAAFLQAAIVIASYATIRLFLPFRVAWLVALAGAIAVGGSASINFMYYATELVPAAALSVAVLAFVYARRSTAPSAGWLAAAAFFAGIAPWAKLQATPISALLCGLALWQAARGTTGIRRLGALALVTASATAPTVAIVMSVYLGGVFADFWASYFVANLGYAGGVSSSTIGTRLGQLLWLSQLSSLMAALAALGLYCVIKRRTAKTALPRVDSWIPVTAGSYLVVSVYCCVQPPHGFGHYHLFLIGPLLVTLGVLARYAIPSETDGQPGSWLRGSGLIAAACVLLPVGAIAIQRYQAAEPLRQHLEERLANRDRMMAVTVAREIKRLAPQASSLAVWGWLPALHVESGLPSATRQTTSHFLIDAGPSRDFLRRQFMQDVLAARPDVVVDAVASDCFTWFWPVESSGLESFPEFATYVRENYALALSIVGDQHGVPLRIFVRQPAKPAGP
jgi:hypothetical protein